jgi:hypothetical protein
MKKLLFALLGLLLIGASLAPLTTSASPASQTHYSNGPTPTPMRGIQRHG